MLMNWRCHYRNLHPSSQYSTVMRVNTRFVASKSGENTKGGVTIVHVRSVYDHTSSCLCLYLFVTSWRWSRVVYCDLYTRSTLLDKAVQDQGLAEKTGAPPCHGHPTCAVSFCQTLRSCSLPNFGSCGYKDSAAPVLINIIGTWSHSCECSSYWPLHFVNHGFRNYIGKDFPARCLPSALWLPASVSQTL